MVALAPHQREYGESLGYIPRHADHCGASLLATPEIPCAANPCTERHDELVAETGTDPSAGSYKIVRPLKGCCRLEELPSCCSACVVLQPASPISSRRSFSRGGRYRARAFGQHIDNVSSSHSSLLLKTTLHVHNGLERGGAATSKRYQMRIPSLCRPGGQLIVAYCRDDTLHCLPPIEKGTLVNNAV